MLFEKNAQAPAEGDIVTFKLTTGEEVVGKLRAKVANGVSIGRPVTIHMQMVGPQQAQIGFAPFLASVPDEQTVIFTFASMTVEPVKTRPDVANNYRRATTNIEVPAAGATSGLIGL